MRDLRQEELRRLCEAVDSAEKRGVNFLSVEFPEQPDDLFERLCLLDRQNYERTPSPQDIPGEYRFYIENTSNGIAEYAVGSILIIKKAMSTGIKEFREIGFSHECLDCNISLKIFTSLCFSPSGEASAHIPQWQISRFGGKTHIIRNIITADIQRKESLNNKTENIIVAEQLHSGADDTQSRIDRYVREYKYLTDTKSHQCGGIPKLISGKCSEDRDEKWYIPRAEKALAAIKRGEIEKIVISRSASYEACDNSAISAELLLQKLRKKYLGCGCTIYCSSAQKGKAFLGASPETLVRVTAGTIETEALAGSIPFRGKNLNELSQKLLHDDKELREHKAVVDFIAKELQSVGAETEPVPASPEISILPNILHLRTPIRAKPPVGKGIMDAVRALHPTPAMCGVPTKKAMEMLDEFGDSRGYFSGAIGYFDERGDGFFTVAIRCAEISQSSIRLYAGAGLVDGSVPARESAEIDAKLDAIRSLLPIV